MGKGRAWGDVKEKQQYVRHITHITYIRESVPLEFDGKTMARTKTTSPEGVKLDSKSAANKREEAAKAEGEPVPQVAVASGEEKKTAENEKTTTEEVAPTNEVAPTKEQPSEKVEPQENTKTAEPVVSEPQAEPKAVAEKQEVKAPAPVDDAAAEKKEEEIPAPVDDDDAKQPESQPPAGEEPSLKAMVEPNVSPSKAAENDKENQQGEAEGKVATVAAAASEPPLKKACSEKACTETVA